MELQLYKCKIVVIVVYTFMSLGLLKIVLWLMWEYSSNILTVTCLRFVQYIAKLYLVFFIKYKSLSMLSLIALIQGGIVLLAWFA